MSNANGQFLPFRNLDDVQAFRPEIQALFNYHWERFLKNNKSLSQKIDAAKFFQLWQKLIDECGAAECSIAMISDNTGIPIQLISKFCLGDNPDTITLSIKEAEKLLIFHHKVCPDLQPKNWGYK